MKKLLPLVIIAVALTFTSCKKNYTCTCTDSSTGTSVSTGTIHGTKSQATSACNDEQSIYSGTTVSCHL